MFYENVKEIGGDCFNTFTILNEGFKSDNGKYEGFVWLECRISDMKSEGNAFFIDVTDSEVAKKGDYSPLELDKKELGDFISYLKRCYSEM